MNELIRADRSDSKENQRERADEFSDELLRPGVHGSLLCGRSTPAVFDLPLGALIL
jgi:hypothetical protein